MGAHASRAPPMNYGSGARVLTAAAGEKRVCLAPAGPGRFIVAWRTFPVSRPPPAAMPILLAAFVLSGAAGLIYESIWSRYLGLLVGHSAYAQIIVLVIFLGGMSLGAWMVGERSQRIANPLRAYALVEIAAGLLGLAFHGVFAAASTFAYDVLFPGLAGSGALLVAKWTLAALLILPQSVLLGTTFPLMTAGAIRLAGREPGRTLALMYFANSLGAAAGVLLAGFVLLEWGGLEGALAAAAVLNLLVAGMVLGARRLWEWETPSAVSHRPSADTTETASVELSDVVAADGRRPTESVSSAGRRRPMVDASRPTVNTVLLTVALLTATASFAYEIAWIRMLSLVLGSATHSFELMLSAFILGLSLGAFLVRRHADRFRDPIRALAIVQVAMGTLAIATLPVYLWSFGWMVSLQDAVALTDGGYRIFAVARYALCVLVMFPATVCAGMTLPLITRTLYMTHAGERAIGRVYGINTLGSIAGVAVAGLVLMPLLGLKWLLVAGALLDVALGVLLLVWLWHRMPDRELPVPPAAAAAVGAFLVATIVMTPFDATVLSSGVFRRGTVPARGAHVIHHHRDGRTATVTVKQVTRGTTYTLSTNGKPDASIAPGWNMPQPPGAPLIALGGDMSTQVLLALTTMAHAPGARAGAVIGQGSGVTSHFMLASPALTHLATIEIEPEMIAASRIFQPFNRRVFTDPRAQFVIADAKSYFAASDRRYDVILSEPSNPWVSGVSGLFTDEFYARVRQHLTPGGVFGQWLHLYEIDDQLVSSVLAAIDRNFADYALYFTANLDVLVVATPAGTLVRPDWQAVTSWPAVREDLRAAFPLTPEALERTRVATREVLHPMLANVTPNSDYAPVLDLGAERTRFLRTSATGLSSLHTRRFDLVRALTGDTLRFATVAETPLDMPRIEGAAMSARLRARRDGAVRDSGGTVRERRLRQQQVQLDAVLAAPRPPADWRVWLELVTEVEQGLHIGTAGVADEAFWQPVLAYAARHDAPTAARAALDLLYGIAIWDWPRVTRAAPLLVGAQRAGSSWVSDGILRDAAVVAFLRQGNPRYAREVLRRWTLTADKTEAAYEYRTQLLFWYVERAVAEGSATAPAVSPATPPAR